MRLTADLVQEALSYLNPLKERELDLRGQRIPAIENLGVAGPHDAIDLTDNDIQVVGNIPLSPRLTTLLLARNRVVSIQPGLAKAAPNLKNLVLASNNVEELADLDPLGGFPRLTHLILAENPVTKKEHYRSWVLWRCPSVRFLDYQKVKEAEREQARQLFGTVEEPTALATEIMSRKTRYLAPSINGSAPPKAMQIKRTAEEINRLKERISKATNLQEILALEKELEEGVVPSGAHPEGMEE
ncbi:U2 small nuclear ribonucleoprotein A' [Hirsutella minnesotensis 3608]|nr:U2 small nuclear ribonucleoprotein A' [Hirsutella minnesotensis 3608]